MIIVLADLVVTSLARPSALIRSNASIYDLFYIIIKNVIHFLNAFLSFSQLGYPLLKVSQGKSLIFTVKLDISP